MPWDHDLTSHYWCWFSSLLFIHSCLIFWQGNVTPVSSWWKKEIKISAPVWSRNWLIIQDEMHSRQSQVTYHVRVAWDRLFVILVGLADEGLVGRWKCKCIRLSKIFFHFFLYTCTNFDGQCSFPPTPTHPKHAQSKSQGYISMQDREVQIRQPRDQFSTLTRDTEFTDINTA